MFRSDFAEVVDFSQRGQITSLPISTQEQGEKSHVPFFMSPKSATHHAPISYSAPGRFVRVLRRNAPLPARLRFRPVEALAQPPASLTQRFRGSLIFRTKHHPKHMLCGRSNCPQHRSKCRLYARLMASRTPEQAETGRVMPAVSRRAIHLELCTSSGRSPNPKGQQAHTT